MVCVYVCDDVWWFGMCVCVVYVSVCCWYSYVTVLTELLSWSWKVLTLCAYILVCVAMCPLLTLLYQSFLVKLTELPLPGAAVCVWLWVHCWHSYVNWCVLNWQNYRYLELLSVLCVCDGVSIADNQTYITEAWLMRGNKVSALIIVPCLYFLSLYFCLLFMFSLCTCVQCWRSRAAAAVVGV